MAEEKTNKQIQIKASEEDLKGRYANLTRVAHTKEEFVLDFLHAVPPMGTLVSRVVLSPGHVKRLVKVLQKHIEGYEKHFGGVEEAEEPGKVGFKV